MATFQQQYSFDNDYYVQVCRDRHEDKWESRFVLQLCLERSHMEVAQLHLRALDSLSYSGFGEEDFFQHGLKSIEPGKGYAHKLHDFLIAQRSNIPFFIRNVYSTNPAVDNLYFVQPNYPRLYISESAIRFWNNRIKQGKAEYVEELKRYRIKWD